MRARRCWLGDGLPCVVERGCEKSDGKGKNRMWRTRRTRLRSKSSGVEREQEVVVWEGVWVWRLERLRSETGVSAQWREAGSMLVEGVVAASSGSRWKRIEVARLRQKAGGNGAAIG
jgi:hypothetical protein